VRSHAIAYSALFLALTGSAAAVTGIQTKAQDRPADEVLVYPAKFVHPGDEETLLRANGIKVVGVCAADSSQIKIGPVQDGGPQRVMTVYSDSHTRGFVHGSTRPSSPWSPVPRMIEATSTRSPTTAHEAPSMGASS
jgi:hypothetical protein